MNPINLVLAGVEGLAERLEAHRLRLGAPIVDGHGLLAYGEATPRPKDRHHRRLRRLAVGVTEVEGKDEEETVESEAQNAEDVRDRLARSRSAAIKRHLEQAGLAADGVTVDARGELVILEGRVADQEAREKLVLAAGNFTDVTRLRSGPASLRTLEESEPKSAHNLPEAVYDTDSLDGPPKVVYDSV